jgi:hypothetical protein
VGAGCGFQVVNYLIFREKVPKFWRCQIRI